MHVTIIGAGRVGQALAAHANELVSREELTAWLEQRAVSAEQRHTPGSSATHREANDAHDANDTSTQHLIVMAVPVTAIPDIVRAMTRTWHGVNHTSVIHTSGAHGPAELADLRELGCAVGVAHPFQTFGAGVATSVGGIGWGVECDESAWPVLREWIVGMNGYPHRFVDRKPEDRLIYHATAVAASNLPYASLDLARRLANAANIPPEHFVVPIFQQMVRNAVAVLASGKNQEPFPVSGPLARLDEQTVVDHLSALPASEREMYRMLSLALLQTLEDQAGNDAGNDVGKQGTAADTAAFDQLRSILLNKR